MKALLIVTLLLIGASSFGQKTPNSQLHQDFAIENITFKSQGAELSGTILTPGNSDAAVVLIHGSGQEKRMMKMASLLARNGITVLTYDKRGVGESEGKYAGPEVGTNNIDVSNLNLLARDASCAASTLLSHLPAGHGPVGLMGFSQAGWIIPIAASQNHHVNFMVLFSGPVVSTLEQLRFQFYTAGNAGFWETHTEAEARAHIYGDADRYKFAATDPRDKLARLRIPGLWLFGGRDVQIPVNLSIAHLDLLKAQGKPYDYMLFPQLGHNIAFSDSADPVADAIDWIKIHSGHQPTRHDH